MSRRRFGPANLANASALAILAIAACGLALRLWDIEAIPPGLHLDQAANTHDALSIWQGARPAFFEGNTGRETLFMYVLAPVLGIFGPGVVPIRLASVSFGALTVVTAYLLGREMLGHRIGLYASAFCALTYLEVAISRLGLRIASLPATEALGVYFALRGLRTKSWWLFPLSGLFFGLSLHTYIASRLLTPVLLLMVVGVIVTGAKALPSRALRAAASVCVVLTAVAVASPLIEYYVSHPEMWTARTDRVTIINPFTDLQGWLATSSRTLGAFFVAGDWDPRYNLPGRPIFDPVSGLCLLVGFVQMTRACSRRVKVLVAVWIAVIVGPLMFTLDTPNYVRMAGMAPALYLIPALGLAQIETWCRKSRWAMIARVAPVITLAVFAVTGLSTARDYLVVYRDSPAAYTSTHGDVRAAVQAVRDIAALSPEIGKVYLSSAEYHMRPQPYTALAGASDLIQGFDASKGIVYPSPTAGRVAYVFIGSQVGDWGRVDRMMNGLTPALRRYSPDGREAVRVFTTAGADFRPTPRVAMEARFGDAIQLSGFDLAQSFEPGKQSALTLYWTPIAHKWYDWRWAATLMTADGRPVSRTVLSDSLHVNSWRVGEMTAISMLLDVPGDLSPGPYYVRLEILKGSAVDRVEIFDGLGRTAGTALRLGPTRLPGSPRALPKAAIERDVAFGEVIRLIGQTPLTGSVRAGDSTSVSLVWRRVEPTSKDYHFFVHLVGADGKLWSQFDGVPNGGELPTFVWFPEETVIEEVSLKVPSDMPAGRARLLTGFYELADGQRLPVLQQGTATGDAYDLGSVTVTQ